MTTSTSIPDLHHIHQKWSHPDEQLFLFFSKHFSNQSKISTSFNFVSSMASIYLTQNIKKKVKDRKTSYQYEEIVNLILTLPDQNKLWTRFSDSDVKIHYHHGNNIPIKFVGNWNLYGSFSSTRKLKNSSFKFGAMHKYTNGLIDLRMRFNIGEYRSQHYFYAKNQWNIGNLNIGFVGVFDLYRKFLQKNDISLGFKINEQHWVGSQFNCEGFRNYQINYSRLGNYFDNFRVAYVFSKDKLGFGLKYDYSIEQSETKKIEAAIQYQQKKDSNWLKLRFNSLMEAGVAGRVPVSDRTSLIVGFSWLNITNLGLPNSAKVTLLVE